MAGQTTDSATNKKKKLKAIREKLWRYRKPLIIGGLVLTAHCRMQHGAYQAYDVPVVGVKMYPYDPATHDPSADAYMTEGVAKVLVKDVPAEKVDTLYYLVMNKDRVEATLRPGNDRDYEERKQKGDFTTKELQLHTPLPKWVRDDLVAYKFSPMLADRFTKLDYKHIESKGHHADSYAFDGSNNEGKAFRIPLIFPAGRFVFDANWVLSGPSFKRIMPMEKPEGADSTGSNPNDYTTDLEKFQKNGHLLVGKEINKEQFEKIRAKNGVVLDMFK